ncbi:MAG: HAMP domain-containing histidine kinase, partial [Proteobacteria bacterium]|nr:HAMP domain-containing histidine kinase [Pseudomonadota bacterium]
RHKIEEKDPNHEMLTGFVGMDKNIKRITEIVTALQQYAGISTSQSVEIVSAKDIIDGALQFCSERLKINGIELTIEKMPEDILIECNFVDVVQVLFNLLSNSHDAAFESDKKWINISVNDNGKNVQFSVTDSGLGITPALAQSILLPFFTTKTPGKGTGLGLSVALRLAKNHGGSLKFDKNAANTRFVLEIPKSYAGNQTNQAA